MVKEIRDPSIILWTSGPKPDFDGMDDYIQIPDTTLPTSQIKFFCHPIDFHTILHILKALVKNWGRNCIYIVGQEGYPVGHKPLDSAWRPQGRCFNGQDDFIDIGNKEGTSIIIDEPSLMRELSHETISSRMLMGTTCWWEKMEGNWVFRWTENRDVFDEIFGSPNPIAFVKVYVHILSKEEREMLELYDKTRFSH